MQYFSQKKCKRVNCKMSRFFEKWWVKLSTSAKKARFSIRRARTHTVSLYATRNLIIITASALFLSNVWSVQYHSFTLAFFLKTHPLAVFYLTETKQVNNFLDCLSKLSRQEQRLEWSKSQLINVKKISPNHSTQQVLQSYKSQVL